MMMMITIADETSEATEGEWERERAEQSDRRRERGGMAGVNETIKRGTRGREAKRDVVGPPLSSSHTHALNNADLPKGIRS